jgi:hypothetical protein
MMIRKLKIGLKVRCPQDRGNPSYYGTIVSYSNDVNYNINKIPYVWVTIESNGSKSIWPSNRLN